jgi:hypothetical protein
MTSKSTLMPAVAAIRPPRSKMTTLTEQAQEATYLARLEAERLQHRTPTLWRRAMVFAAREAGRRGQELGPEHLLFGLLLDARDPAGTDLYPNERREHAYLGLPVRGPHPVRLLIEARGASLETLLEAVRGQLDQDTARPITAT